ncbi:ABC transporter permease [Mucilaginibacter conchicola]|uniref:ABC transporter permease n=1 Tax=Mucilaginibacter conchicola TaxID=2303333 RepID=A0A372NXF0_9SPHI|nr:ABC transporter permease [Mucilaginibacter conchicola]RFZ94207.1 ABC transporter permease [Mucilaginibacter conchicola]
MLKNYFKIAWRSLLRHKAYSLINIIGLSVGLIACLIVSTVVTDELSYDRQWSKTDRIYRVLSVSNTVKGEAPMPVTFSGLGPSMKRDLPETEDYCRISVIKNRLKLTSNEEGISFNVLEAEPTLWNMFNVKVLEGDPKKFVKGYTNLIINKTVRDQYFKNQNPLGKVIMTVPEFGEPQKYLITGVVDNIPQNTHLRADVITLKEYRTGDNAMPTGNSFYTFQPQYVLLKKGTDIPAFTKKVNNWYAANFKGKVLDYKFNFQPLKDIYLKSDFPAVQEVHGSIRNVYIFAIIAALLLLIACINFVNLTISRVFTRARETGVRKVLGAGKGQLISRFMAESLLFFVISFAIAIVLYPVLIKFVETYLGHSLVINLFNGAFLLSAVLAITGVSLLTGLYPAWYLSKPKPSIILRDKIPAGVGLNLLKRSLIIGQFTISAIIIIATLVVRYQVNFMSHQDPGFDKNNLVNIDFTDWGKSGESFKNAVKQISGVEGVSITNWYPSAGSGSMSRDVNLGDKRVVLYFIQGDADLPYIMGFRLKKGRLFNRESNADALSQDSLMGGASTAKTKQQIQNQPIIATEYTAKLMGLKLNTPAGKFEGMPVGVVSDFYSESLHNKIKATVIQAITNQRYGAMLIKTTPGSGKNVLTAVNKLYKSYYPAKPFNYSWVSDLIDQQYRTEFKLQQLFTCFSLLIIFLACMGLFGLVAFAVEQRVKEIGIRKVLGASVQDIIALVSGDFLKLVFVAFIIASPIAWYAMNMWLQNYAYRVNIPAWAFAVAGCGILFIAFITISFRSITAALTNPAKSLRSE